MVFILKIIFVVTNDINHIVILGTIFSDMITPYKTGHENITSKINGLKLVFPSLEKPKTRNLNIIKAYCIYIHQINALISEKKTQFMHLKQDVFLKKKIEQQLQNLVLQKGTSDFRNKIESEICSDLPNTFWKRKQHVVDLPYDDNFNGKTNTYKS
jgi:hypothetical protein